MYLFSYNDSFLTLPWNIIFYHNVSIKVLASTNLYMGYIGVSLFVSLVTEIETNELQDSPMTKSMSPSDFWSKRWNCLMSGLLKVNNFEILSCFRLDAFSTLFSNKKILSDNLRIFEFVI